MFPDDEDARRLARQTHTLGEFLATYAQHWELPRLDREAVVHFHCHQRATSDTDRDRHVFERLGLDYEVLDTGCCGLAGSFGYERGERYEVSIKAGETAPASAGARGNATHAGMTDGFSCRSQIDHGSSRSALHLAQVIQMALHEGPNGPATAPPEARYSEPSRAEGMSNRTQAAAGVIAAPALGETGALARRRRRERVSRLPGR
jgi:Fe-S oxidoreductase